MIKNRIGKSSTYSVNDGERFNYDAGFESKADVISEKKLQSKKVTTVLDKAELWR